MPFFRSILLCIICSGSFSVSAADHVQFNRDIRTILSANCYRCHGPDAANRKADLRLDQADAARDSGVIVAGHPSDSELWNRISSHDPDEVMPPPEANLDLSPEQVELLRRWIEQGADFQGHWAFLAPNRVSVPHVEDVTDVRNPIDAFVQNELLAKNLEPSAEADRRTLIRRATFDLWGLPPSPQEIDAFLADTQPDAYERLLDRLLDSPRYGERMTVAWMDASRYGDTSVFHADGPRDMWPWRDWVLKAYNSNLPFDEFTVAQLAGDLLPNPTTDQLVATGFNRNHGTTDEGGAIDEEYRVEYIVDRVKTTSMVWLGLTMECAQCHDHKYDPITQEDYYRFFAFFNQTPEKGMQTRNGNEEPRVFVATDEQQDRLTQINSELAQARDELANHDPSTEEFEAWLAKHSPVGKRTEPVFSVWNYLGPFVGKDLKTVFKKEFGPEKGVDVEKEYNQKQFQEFASWKDGDVVTFETVDPNAASYVYRTITVDEPTTLPVSLGSDDTISVWLNKQRLLNKNVTRGAAADQEKLELELIQGKNELLLKICNASGPTGFFFQAGMATLPSEITEVLQIAIEERSADQIQKLRSYYKDKVWPRGDELRQQIVAVEKRKADYETTVPTVMVMRDVPEPRMTFVLDRGNYAAPNKDRSVMPGPPNFLPQFDNDNLESRLGLAQWMTNKDHPLTARVAVNRYWTMLFGRGIVATVADFGSQGAWPSHPELLDYLAIDFIESGWNVKRMLRQIMTSHTYRQSSRTTDTHRATDPLNVYLARAPRLRLPAEFIRDNALALAGLMVERVGGPGVKPYQPPGLWNEVSLSGDVRFVQDHGEHLYRRTMYTYWKRSSPQPAMMTFDVPTREKCVIQRQRTNTPLQALVTLNDVQFVEAAREMAARILLGAAQDDFERIDFAFVLATSRPADNTRRQAMLELLKSERDRFTVDREAAEALVSVGESARDASIDVTDHAAWTILSSVILNLDETLNKE